MSRGPVGARGRAVSRAASWPRPRRARLANGLTVLLCRTLGLPVVSVWCWYRVGSRDERPGLTGISHWVEHMNFKGTRRIPKEQITRRVELHGGLWNGYTWLDVTTYLETVEKNALEEMLRLEASRMHECVYSDVEVERERTVVISEMQGGENDPRAYLERETVGTALQAHPYRWPTIGYLSDLKAITRDDLQHYYRTHYVPNNAVLVVAGDFEEAAALRAVRRHFGRIPGGPPPPRVRTVEPEQTGERRVVVRRPAATPYLDVAFHAPAAADPGFPALLILDGILNGAPTINLWAAGRFAAPGKSSRLYRALVERGLATDVSTSVIPTRHPFLYRIAVTVRQGIEPARAEAALLAEIDRLARGEVEERDLERARNQFLARAAIESESPTDIAHLLGFFETVADHRLAAALIDGVRRVDAGAVVSLARARLTEARRTVGLLLPEDGGRGGEA